MKRLRRIIFNALTALSLLLFLATLGLWVRSYITADIIEHSRASGKGTGLTAEQYHADERFQSDRGKFVIQIFRSIGPVNTLGWIGLDRIKPDKYAVWSRSHGTSLIFTGLPP